MSKYDHFSMMPNISIPRSMFKMEGTHTTSFNFGKLIPIDCREVVPGDSFKLNLSSFIRLAQPIFPFMSNLYVYVHAFFTPMRLLWSHTEEFYGANKTSSGPQNVTYTIPKFNFGKPGITGSSLSHYLGKPRVIGAASGKDVYASILKERAYYLIWNEWYRPQQLVDPVILNTSDTGDVGTWNGVPIQFYATSGVMSVAKKFDYFTAGTISPQYGQAVELPLGDYAKLGVLNDLDAYQVEPFSRNVIFGVPTNTQGDTAILGNDDTKGRLGSVSYGDIGDFSGYSTGSFPYGFRTNLVADLSHATAATINDLRYAFAVQKYLERSNFGTRFFEMLKAHYGITSPDARLQRPEYLGGTSFMINISQVLSTAGYAPGASQQVGSTGAISVTSNKSHIFSFKGFLEPGYLTIMLCTKQDHIYSQGFLREDIKFNRFEFYSPEFANLGDQSITKKEIFGDVDDATSADVFNYQEHWAEYRYFKSHVSGALDPAVTGPLDAWTLANNFGSIPSFNADFIMENRNNISRVLAQGSSGPDFIADFYFDYTAIRELPTYSIPGLVDHFGSM